MKNKKQVRIRINDILDKCQSCTKFQQVHYAERANSTDVLKICGGCTLHRELTYLGKVLDKKEELPLDLTVEEFVQLYYVDKKPLSEIAELKGITKESLYNFKYYRKDAIKQAADSMGLFEKDAISSRGKNLKKRNNNPPSEKVDWKAKCTELEIIINDQSLEIKGLLERCEQLKTQLDEFSQLEPIVQTEHINAACEDIESELASVREENTRLIEGQYQSSYTIEDQNYKLEQFEKHNSDLNRENLALKQLLVILFEKDVQ